MSEAGSIHRSPTGSGPDTPNSNLAGRYQLLELLGTGGMATVVRARELSSGRYVALKQLRPEITADKRATYDALFAREYHTLARLSHRRIVQVYEYGIADGRPYYTMELLTEADLRQLAPLPYRDACRHLRDIASSLALIHAHRLVHRDVSPRNVRLAADGSAKLIDFGALASFGASQDIIGTPPCMAPEMLRGMPLDQRTDLYALGAVAYFSLTGRHAYPARTLQELTAVWQSQPALPSSFDASIPGALDALVMSLLNADPTARPPSAAVVIDQLTSIAELEPEELERGAESYLLSGRMVGRAQELRWVCTELEQAKQAKGRAILFEGMSGIGKTRLLHELCLEAQLRGAVLLRADAEENGAAFGLAASLLLNLLRVQPELRRSVGERDWALLSHLSPALREQLGTTVAVELSVDPAERRARFQIALQACFLKVAREQLVFIAIDNAHALEDNSAALLAALAAEAQQLHLVLVATQRSEASLEAPATYQALRKRSSCVRLRGLHAADCADLVKSLFGEAVNTGRLARWFYERSSGNPRRGMELARQLVKRGIAKYVGGSWVLPLDIAASEMPAQADDVLARLHALSAPAVLLCDVLSIYERAIPLPHALAHAAAEGCSDRAVHGALDELLQEDVLIHDGARVRFVQSDEREALIKRMDPGLRQTRHRRAAELILAGSPETLMECVDAAWHLLLGGDESRGAALIITSIQNGLRHRLEPDSFEQIVTALLAALSVYDRQQRGPHDTAEILFPLMSFGFLVDWRVAETYGLRAIEVGLDITGLALAERLRPKVGRIPALVVGLVSALVRFRRRRRGSFRSGLPAAIESFCAMVPPMIASWTMRYDQEGAARLIEMLTPLRLFGKRHVTTLMHDYGVAQLKMVQGRVVEARELLATIQPRFEAPGLKRLMNDTHLRLLKGGGLFCAGILAPIACDNGELQIAAELEALEVQLWQMGAAQVRVLHHGLRGEIQGVDEHLERVEAFAIQGGTTWQADLFWPFLLLQCYLETEDRLGARRCVEQLHRRAREASSLVVFAELGQAAYLASRGELKAALALFERNSGHLNTATGVAWPVLRTWFAEALIADGQAQRAKDLLLDTLARLGPDHRYVRREQIQLRRWSAIADHALGRTEAATATLNALLDAHGALDQPLIVGLLHRTRAELALKAGDRAKFQQHAAEMESRFAATRNPALIAQCERLMTGATQSKPEWSKSVSPAQLSDLRVLKRLRLDRDRYDGALQLIVQRSRAKAAHLYWRQNGELQRVASSEGSEPLRELEALLFQRIAHAENELHEREEAEATQHLTVMERSAKKLRTASGDHSGIVSSRPSPLSVATFAPRVADVASSRTETVAWAHHVFPLLSRGGGTIVGGVILEVPMLGADGLTADFLESLSAELADHFRR